MYNTVTKLKQKCICWNSIIIKLRSISDLDWLIHARLTAHFDAQKSTLLTYIELVGRIQSKLYTSHTVSLPFAGTKRLNTSMRFRLVIICRYWCELGYSQVVGLVNFYAALSDIGIRRVARFWLHFWTGSLPVSRTVRRPAGWRTVTSRRS